MFFLKEYIISELHLSDLYNFFGLPLVLFFFKVLIVFFVMNSIGLDKSI